MHMQSYQILKSDCLGLNPSFTPHQSMFSGYEIYCLILRFIILK